MNNLPVVAWVTWPVLKFI